MRVPFLRSDPSLVAFLSVQDDKDFAAAKEQTGVAKLTVFNSQEEGAEAWREAVGCILIRTLPELCLNCVLLSGCTINRS